ncbi:MAG TPA: GntR family transcriptional regulator [Roseomonas sp.]|jgi:GntR family transcriptional regulator
MLVMARASERDGESPLPLYHRIYLVLRQRIAEGQWKPDAAMPGEHDLALGFNVSRITIRRALERLEREGLINRRRGSGTFAQPGGEGAPIRQDLGGLLENLVVMGRKTSARVLAFGYAVAPAEVSAALEVPARDNVQRSVRVRSHRGQPFSHLTAWVPEEIGHGFGRADLARRPLLILLKEAGFAPAEADQLISARPADATVAEALQVEVGSALLYVRRQVRDARGRAVEYLQALYRPDLYEYHMGMRRVSRFGRSLWTTQTESAD